jgi:hypothetical protein
MSNVKLQASASGTGTVTIAPPVTNSDLTINLPANSGTVPTIASVVNNGVVYTNSTGAITSSSALTFDGTNLGVGTSTPGTKLHVTGSNGLFVQFLNSQNNTGEGLVFGSGTNLGRISTNGASTAMAFEINAVEKARLDSSGNLGLGVTPSAWNSAVRAIELLSPGSAIYGLSGGTTVTAGAYIDSVGWKYGVSGVPITRYDQGAFASGQHTWFNAASGTAGNAISWTQAMTLDASGNLGIGTSSPDARLTIASAGRGRWYRSDNTRFGDVFMDSDGFNVVAQSAGDNLTLGSLNVITFRTASSERARITSGGLFFVGVTSQQGGGSHCIQAGTGVNSLQMQNNGATPYGPYINFSAAAPNNGSQYFIFCADTAATRMILYANGGLANYQANNSNLSDRREKTNFAPAKDYLDTICAIPVQTFNYIDQNMEEDAGLTLGVVAQDVQAVAPELVSESNWGTKDDPKMRLSIYQTDLQYALMKALQELNAKVESLTTELNALKGT